jgi:processive 1,2-diacylglycerol beta-glucosyltransferase
MYNDIVSPFLPKVRAKGRGSVNMRQAGKLVLLSGDFGDGHRQAANALVEAAEHYMPDLKTVSVDLMELTHPKTHRAAKYLYMQGVSKFPSVYGYLYRKTRSLQSEPVWKKLRLLGAARLLHLLSTENPDAVVSTFPIASAAVSLLKSGGLTDLPLITVITDHTDHSYWIHPHTDMYVVGSDKVKRALTSRNVPASRVTVTGIPVRLAFGKTYDRAELLQKYRLDPGKLTVMVMGGGYGMVPEDLSDLLRLRPSELQWIVVCGHNDKLYLELSREWGFTSNVRLFGYVQQVHELMAVSDLLISKPGGLTTSEAVSLGLPMLLYRTLPGQEQDNAEYLVNAGAALQADDAPSLSAAVRMLADRPELLSRMKANAAAIRPHEPGLQALRAIVRTIARGKSEKFSAQTGARPSYLFYT